MKVRQDGSTNLANLQLLYALSFLESLVGAFIAARARFRVALVEGCA
jgi:hypothetical protein